jgi:hypothetical protein
MKLLRDIDELGEFFSHYGKLSSQSCFLLSSSLLYQFISSSDTEFEHFNSDAYRHDNENYHISCGRDSCYKTGLDRYYEGLDSLPK